MADLTGFALGVELEMLRQVSAPFARGHGRATLEKGDRVLVTRLGPVGVSVRPVTLTSSPRRVLVIPAAAARPALRAPGEVPLDGVAPEDPRVAWLLDDAAVIARQLGLGTAWERIADTLGVPGRERTFTVDVASAEGIEVTARVQARSQRLAEQRLRATLTPTRQLGTTYITEEHPHG